MLALLRFFILTGLMLTLFSGVSKAQLSCRKLLESQEAHALGRNSDQGLLKLKLFEAVAQESGWDLLNLTRFMDQASERDQKKVLKLLKKFSLEDGISAQKLDSLIVKLYEISNSDPINLNFSITDAEEKLIQKRIELAFVRQSFLEAMQELGFVRSPSMWAQLQALRSQFSNYENMLIMASINVFSIAQFGFPIQMSKLSLGAHIEIPPEMIQKIKSKGILAIREDMRKLFSQNALFELSWNSFQKLYAKAMFGFAVFMSIQMLPMLEFAIASRFTSDQELAQIQEATFNPQKIREEQFNNWKKAFFEFEGRYPDPSKYPQDAAEWNRVWNSLQKISDEQLKVQFKKNK